MPVYRGIKLSIISQYGAQALPEYSPSRIFDHDTLAPAPDHLPALLDSTTHTATVYVPIFPRSLYWIRYHVYVPKSNSFFYFKAFINGTHIVSWGVGEADGYGGKVMFGLYDNGRGSGRPSRQLLAFSDDTSLDYHASIPPGEESLEIRIYRSKARRTIDGVLPPPVNQGSSQTKKADAVRFRNAFGFKAGGEVDLGHPTTQYEYALVDPIDTPYVTFRWLPRTWHELDQLDVISLDTEPGSASITRALSSHSNTSKADAEATANEAQTVPEQHGTTPFRISGEGSPLRVPVYQVSCSTLEPDKSPTRGSVAARLASPDSKRSSDVQLRSEDDTKTTPATSLPRRSNILEPYNSLDRVATAQPANRATLLDSVVSQLRSQRPGSPHSKKALQQYLERRHPKRSTSTSTEDSSFSNITYVTRVRADSYQAKLESAPGQNFDGNPSDSFGESVEALALEPKTGVQQVEKDGKDPTQDTTPVANTNTAIQDSSSTDTEMHRSFVLRSRLLPTGPNAVDETCPSSRSMPTTELCGFEAAGLPTPVVHNPSVVTCYRDQSKSVERPPCLDVPGSSDATNSSTQKWFGARMLSQLPKGSLRPNRKFGQ